MLLGLKNYYSPLFLPYITGTKDFIRHTSQVANPRCPQRFVPSFHVLLLGTSTPRAFHKLYGDAGQCNAQCCRSRDCLLSFIEEDECYGVTGRLTGHNSTKGVQEPRIGLQVAIIDRNKGESNRVAFLQGKFSEMASSVMKRLNCIRSV